MNNLNITLTTVTFLSAILLLLSYTNQWSPDHPDADDLRTAQIVQACESVGHWDTGTVRIYCSVKE